MTATDEYGSISQPMSATFAVSAYSPMVVNAGGNVTAVEGAPFTFAGSVSGGVAPYSYFWNFGDGSTTTGSLTPTHTYAYNGSYTAFLLVTDATGATSDSTSVVTLPDAVPTVVLTGAPVGTVNSPVTFMASVPDPSAVDSSTDFTYNWNFGDGTTSSGADFAPTHNFTSAGTYTVSVTATDPNGQTSMVATTTIAVSLATVIPITATWLQNNSPGPYLLSQANTTYVLETDVTTSGTGFVIANSNVTLNLNGHTITYDNAAPITVPNGTFGADPIGSTTITDWNTSGAPNSQFLIGADDCYLYGPQVLKWSAPNNTTLAGSLTCTTGSAVVTGMGTSFTSALVNEYLLFSGDSNPTIYQVQSVQSATQLTLTNPIAASANGSGQTANVVQVIKSQNIAIPQANRTYTASVALSDLNSTGACRVMIDVVDAVTGQLVTYWKRYDSGTGAEANCPKFSFLPTTTDPVYIRLIMNPVTGPTSIELDRVVLTQSMDYGVLASSVDCAGLSDATQLGPNARYDPNYLVNGISNIPASMQAVYRNVYAPTIEDSVGTGSITQGQAAGASSPAIELCGTRGNVLVEGVTTYNSGDDSGAIDASNSDTTLTDPTNFRTIRNCTINYSTSVIATTRASLLSAINIAGFSAALVEGCTLNNNPDVGVYVVGGGVNSNGTFSYQVVRNNTFHPNVSITNGYAVYVLGSHVKVLNNTINTATSGSSRGIAVDQGGQTDVEVAGNTVIVRENPNREYGNSGTTARAFELRSWPQYGPLTNIDVHDNYFEAITGAGLMQGATGARVVTVVAGSSGITFTNNTFKAIVVGSTDPGAAYYAHAIEIDDSEVDANHPLVFNNNTFESDDTGIALGGPAVGTGAPVNNLLFQNSTITVTSDPTAVPRTFQSYNFGVNQATMTGVQFLGTSYVNGATSTVTWVGTGQKNVTFGWVLTVQVRQLSG